MSDTQLSGMNFDKLGCDNYHSWKFSMKMYLVGKDLWEIVDGTETQPPVENDDERKKFKKRANLALAAIGLAVKPNLQIYVRNCKTAKEAWESLQGRFEKKTLSKKIYYRKELYHACMPAGSDMTAHIDRIKTLAEHLEAVDDAVSEKDLVMILMSSWPAGYNNLITSLETVDEDKLSWNYVRDRAITECDRKLKSQKHPHDEEAFLADGDRGRGRSRGRGNRRGKKTKLTCHNCHEVGHFVRDCPKKDKDNKKNNDDACVAVSDEQFDDALALHTEEDCVTDTDDALTDEDYALSVTAIECLDKKDTSHNDAPDDVNTLNAEHAPSTSTEHEPSANDGPIANDEPSSDDALSADESDEGNEKALVVDTSPPTKPDCTTSGHWLLDSGCSRHMTHRREDFTRYVELKVPVNVNLADQSKICGIGIGDIELRLFDGTKYVRTVIHGVLHVPKLKNKLLSISDITDRGSTITFKGKSCTLTMNDKVYNLGQRHGKLWHLHCENEECFSVTSASSHVSPELWHQRYAHLSHGKLRELHRKEMVVGLDYDPKAAEKCVCEGCIMGKHHRTPFPKHSTRVTTKPLELIHSDVCGPMSVPSIGGSRYFISFIDNFSRYTVTYMMKKKSEALEKFKLYVAMAETKFGHKVVTCRNDNGGEYVSNAFDTYLRERGTQQERTIPYTPEQNGVAERMNRTLMEKVRSMIYHANMPLRFWAEALNAATYVTNRTPTSALVDATPYERWNGTKPDVSNLRVFGCTAYVHVPDEKRKKLDRKSERGIFVGYPEGVKGYKIFFPESKKMKKSRDVIFVENAFDHNVESGEDPDELLPSICFGFDDDENNDDGNDNHHDGGDDGDAAVDDAGHDDGDNIDRGEVRERPRRDVRPPDFYGDVISHRFGTLEANFVSIGTDDPTSFREAMAGSNACNWKSATDAEIASLTQNETWDLVDLPAGKSVIGSKWVFKTKVNPDGTFSKYKSRLVAQGYSQKQGIDYTEVFAPVVKHESLRTLLALANQYGWDVHQMDVNSAYLNGDIDADIYMKQPEGYVDPNHPNKVCKLRKGLYGLKQGARCWNKKMDAFLKSEGFTASDADPCIYVKREKGKIVILALYVDDTAIATNCPRMLADTKRKLSAQFHMEDLGEIKYILGMMVKRDRQAGTLSIDQRSYLEGVLQRFGMEKCNPVSTPLEPGKQLGKTADEEDGVDTRRYQEIVGSLIYASITTRPDLAHAVNVLSQHMAKPNNEHWIAAKRVLRYIKGTLDVGIVFRKSDNFELVGYSDADWAGDVDSRKSTSGYVFLVGGNIVSWASKKQSVVALSTTEAEYIALCSATQEAIWLRRLLASVEQQQDNPTTIHEDNQGAISMSKNPRNSSRTKHIDIKFHFVREAAQKNEVRIHHCTTQNMVADTLTKGLPKPAFERHRTSLGIGRP